VTLDLPDETWVSEPALAVYASDGTLVATVTDPESSLDLPGGLYTVAARRGTVDGDLVGRAFGLLQDTVQQVCVSDGEITDWSGTWELQPSSGKLWMTSGEDAEGFDPAALAEGGDVAPETAFTVPVSNDLRGLAIDPLGNLWVATSPTYGAKLLVYPPAGAEGGTEPLELGAELFADNVQIQDILFDAKDQLWVLVGGSNTGTVGLWAFAPEVATAFLATGALPTRPSQQLTVTGMVKPEDMVVGPDSRLWIADFDGDQVLSVGVGSAVDQDPTEVAPEQAFTVSWEDDTGTHGLQGPTALGFDADGRLWVNYWTAGTLARFDTTSGASVREPDLMAGSDVLDLLSGLATDRRGGIWFGNERDGGEIVSLDADSGAEDSRAGVGDTPAVDLVFDPAG
jgi:streptogramin lyase